MYICNFFLIIFIVYNMARYCFDLKIAKILCFVYLDQKDCVPFIATDNTFNILVYFFAKSLVLDVYVLKYVKIKTRIHLFIRKKMYICNFFLIIFIVYNMANIFILFRWGPTDLKNCEDITGTGALYFYDLIDTFVESICVILGTIVVVGFTNICAISAYHH
jgi:hypothetical protein